MRVMLVLDLTSTKIPRDFSLQDLQTGAVLASGNPRSDVDWGIFVEIFRVILQGWEWVILTILQK